RRKLSSLGRNPVPLLYDCTTESAVPAAEDSSMLQLYSWGHGASGQLGGGIEEVRIYPAPIANLLVPSGFSLSHATPGRLPPPPPDPTPGDRRFEVGISCGLFHSGLLVDGGLWMWGKGDGGRLGLGHENPVFVPTLNSNLDTNLRSIALGGLHSVALDAFGRVFSWGYGGFGALGHSVYHRELLPRQVEGSWDGEIRHIATSGAHTAAVTSHGKVYVWGRDEGDGRLGLGPNRGPDHAGGMSTPAEVKAMPEPVAAVSCGGFFTMSLTEDGQLWNWGANSNSELGRGDDKRGGWKPEPVPSLRDVRIVQIACGGYHSLALTDKGEVLSWGYGGSGQLGHRTSSVGKGRVPEPVEALADERVTYVACGGSSSAAVTEGGKLYMWGNAAECQVGVPGVGDVQATPVEVRFLWGEEDGVGGDRKVVAVAVGASHTLCIVSRTTT
ncbi:hypothetical protein M569_10592, partial [Genlisea aurea]